MPVAVVLDVLLSTAAVSVQAVRALSCHLSTCCHFLYILPKCWTRSLQRALFREWPDLLAFQPSPFRAHVCWSRRVSKPFLQLTWSYAIRLSLRYVVYDGIELVRSVRVTDVHPRCSTEAHARRTQVHGARSTVVEAHCCAALSWDCCVSYYCKRRAKPHRCHEH